MIFKEDQKKVEIRRLTLRPAGMFSNVNEVIEQLYLAERGGYQFVIDWSASCYKEPDRESDPWNYYFADCFPGANSAVESMRQLDHGIPIACSKDNIITPRERDGKCAPLLMPKDRELPHRFIESNINLKQDLQNCISEQVRNLFSGYVIGLHIRGPGRVDGGTPGTRSKYACKKGVPFGQYFKFVDDCLLGCPEAKIFACSDSAFVIQEITQRYGKKVITYAATRSAFGEMHKAGHPENAGEIFSKYKLGEDVVIEAYMLSQTNFFIHGNSNVVNFVLCKNPLLAHKYVYEP